MRERCLNPRCKSFWRYGGRGIKVCDQWASFAAFLADVGPKPTPEFEIERIDNNKGYEPDNVRWATPAEQAQNTSRIRPVTHRGVTLPLAEWARRVGLKDTTLRQRLSLGWSVERAVETPVNR